MDQIDTYSCDGDIDPKSEIDIGKDEVKRGKSDLGYQVHRRRAKVWDEHKD